MSQATQTRSPFNQLCVWEGTDMTPEEGQTKEDVIRKFEQILAERGMRVKYECEVKTLPGNGGPGGRNDLFFYMHDDDIGPKAVVRLMMGIRWWEDVLGNDNGHLYPDWVLEKYPKSW